MLELSPLILIWFYISIYNSIIVSKYEWWTSKVYLGYYTPPPHSSQLHKSNQFSPSLGHAWANFLRFSMIITSFVLNRLTKHLGSHPAGSNWKKKTKSHIWVKVSKDHLVLFVFVEKKRFFFLGLRNAKNILVLWIY